MSLISSDDLATRLDDPSLRIADCRWYLGDADRGGREYATSHIPGAVYVDLERDLSQFPGPGRHPLPERRVFAERMGALGIGDRHTVVAYDDRSGAVASRLWWMLRDIGHPDVAVLDGGLQAWLAEGRAVTAIVPHHQPEILAVGPGPTRSIDRDGVAERLDGLVLLDARAPERYRGETEPIDPVAGHIPGARNAPLEGNLGADGRFLSPDELAARYRNLGADGDNVVVYCGSGVTACHDALAMVVAGLPEPTLYPGSWSDWSTAGMPVATGED